MDTTQNPTPQQQQQQQQQQLQTVSRISKLPVVAMTLGTVSSLYDKTKTLSPQLADRLEASVRAVSTPLYTPLYTRLSPWDEFGCNQLDRIEAAFPVIQQDPKQIITSSKDYVDAKITSSKDYVDAKITSSKDYVDAKLAAPIRSNINYALDASEHFVDRVLPDGTPVVAPAPVASDKEETMVEEPLPVSSRISRLGYTVRQRVVERAVSRLSVSGPATTAATSPRSDDDILSAKLSSADAIQYAQERLHSTADLLMTKITEARSYLAHVEVSTVTTSMTTYVTEFSNTFHTQLSGVFGKIDTSAYEKYYANITDNITKFKTQIFDAINNNKSFQTQKELISNFVYNASAQLQALKVSILARVSSKKPAAVKTVLMTEAVFDASAVAVPSSPVKSYASAAGSVPTTPEIKTPVKDAAETPGHPASYDTDDDNNEGGAEDDVVDEDDDDVNNDDDPDL